MRRWNLFRIWLLCAMLVGGVSPWTGCKSRETKRTTIEVDTPKTERKITIESTKIKDKDDD